METNEQEIYAHGFINILRKLPTHRHGQHLVSILDNKDFAQDIQEHLQGIAKEDYVWAQDIVDYVSTPAIQES